MRRIIMLTLAALSFFTLSPAFADSYSCAKMIYKDGWLKKYEYKGNTWGANTKKHGVLSSTVGSATEGSTASFDPGVTTGNYMSSTQFTSSWGECSMVDMYITRQFREDYIEQNMIELKKQVALGAGNHVDSIAFLSGCRGIDHQQWVSTLQGHTAELYDAPNGAVFANGIDQLIQSQPDLQAHCSIPNT